MRVLAKYQLQTKSAEFPIHPNRRDQFGTEDYRNLQKMVISVPYGHGPLEFLRIFTDGTFEVLKEWDAVYLKKFHSYFISVFIGQTVIRMINEERKTND